MKLSVSLSESDVATLDQYVEQTGLPSRSAGVQQAIRMLTHAELTSDYAEAFREWDSSADRRLWDRTSTDGISDETW